MNALIRFKNLAPLFIIALSLVTATATTTDVIFSFAEDNGEYADTDLETDSAGNIYGSTVLGGDHGSGTVFQLSPTGTGWEQTVLYSFTGGADGGEPYKGVTIDRHGNLYGTAVTGGSGGCEGGCGVVYKLTNSRWNMEPNSHLRVHGRRRWIWTWRASHRRSERKCVWNDPDGRHVRRRHHLQTPTERWELHVSGDSHIHRRQRRLIRFSRKDASGSRTALRCGHYRRYCMATELFSSSHRQQLASGISGRYIRFTVNPTEVFLTARYSALVRVKSMGPLITVVETALALFTNSLPGPLGNGTRE